MGIIYIYAKPPVITMKAKFSIGDMLPLGMMLVVLGIGLTFGLNVMEDVQGDMGDSSCSGYWNESSTQCEVSSTNSTVLSGNSVAYNASVDAIEGVAKLPEKMPIIVTVIVAAIIIGILTRYLMVEYRG